MRKLHLLLTAIALFLPLSSSSYSQTQDQTSEKLGTWIMERVIRNAEENEKIKRDHITYNKTVYKRNLEKDPPELKSVERFNIYGNEGQSIEKLVERAAINKGKVTKKVAVTNAKPQVSNLNFNSIIGERYNFRLVGEELLNGRGYFLIAFQPKEPLDQLPFNERLDEGINRMYGTLYVDIEELYVWKLEGQLTASFSKAASIFEMKDFSIILMQERKFGVVVPLSLTITYRYRVFFGHTHERLIYTYSGHFDKRTTIGSLDPPQ